MKTTFILLFSVAFSLNLVGQSLQPSAFVSSSGSDLRGSSQVSWVLGEVFTGSLGLISQGSSQSDSILTHVRLISLPSLRIYPNPAHSWLRISGIERPGSWSCKVYTLQGARVFEQELSAYNNNDLSIQGLAVGTYLLLLSSDTGEYYPLQFIKK